MLSRTTQNFTCGVIRSFYFSNSTCWELLKPSTGGSPEKTDASPGWRLQPFTVWLLEAGTAAKCFEYKLAKEEAWVFTLQSIDNAGNRAPDLKNCALAVREVPPDLVFICHLAFEDAIVRFIYTTLDGGEAFEVKRNLPEELTMLWVRSIAQMQADMAGWERSWNQKIEVVVPGVPAALADHIVLWKRNPPIGLLQRA